MYDEYELLLHRELASMSVNHDPPNPFRGTATETVGVRIYVNDTNDLPYQIQAATETIKDGISTTVIIGDPYTIGYRAEILDRLAEECPYPCRYVRNKDWIVFMVNILPDQTLHIQDGKFLVR